LPTNITEVRHPIDGHTFQHGGQPQGNAIASEDAWHRMLLFLESALEL
jgi:hypothetical protein